MPRDDLRSVVEYLRAPATRPARARMVVWAIASLLLWRVWHLRTAGHWDFMVYYWAAKAQAAGLDPYSLHNLSAVAGQQMVLPYLYPPGFLYFFRPLTWLSLHHAIIVFVSLKAIALVLLLRLWRAHLGPKEILPLFLLVVFAFSDTVFNDFFAGNVGTFEQVALWIGFGFLLDQRISLFAAMVILASIAKMTPLAFLVLILFTPHRRRYWVFAAAAMGGAAAVLASFGGSWTRLSAYFRLVTLVDERGPTNTAILPLVKDCYEVLQRRYHAPSPLSPQATYWLIAGFFAGVTGFVLIRLWRRHRDNRDAILDYIVGALLLYAIALPRFKDYSYVLLIPAVVFVGRRITNALPLLVLLASLTARNTLARYTLGDFPLADFLWRYFNLLLTVVLWVAFIFYAWARGASTPAAPWRERAGQVLTPTAGARKCRRSQGVNPESAALV
jgi:hypothetical protein